jgi:hypothetical protein
MISLNILGTIKEVTLADMTEMLPDEGQKIALKGAVDKIYSDLDILTKNIDEYYASKTIYNILNHITEYKSSFYYTNGWFWRPATWKLANDKFEDCLKRLISKRDADNNRMTQSCVDQCNTCIDDMLDYKTLCESIPVKKTMTEQFKAFVRLKSKLEALKDLAS